MALDQSLLTTMEAANIFCGVNEPDQNSTNHLRLTEVKLPGMDEQYVDHRPGGAPVTVEIDTVFARLECTFVLAGWTPQVSTLIDSWVTNQNLFWIYGVLRERETGLPSQARARLRGRLGRADPQNWRKGDVHHWNYAIRGIVFYELMAGEEIIYSWDFFNNTLIVGGSDRTADINSILHTGVTNTPFNPNP